MSTRIENKQLHTPKLRVKWNSLASPFFAKDGKDKKGQYSITVAGTSEEYGDWFDEMAAINAELIEEQLKREGKKMKLSDNVNWEDELDKETQEPTGRTQVKFKHAAKGFNPKTGSEWDIEVRVFNSLGKPVSEDAVRKLGRDSIVRVCYDAVAYVFGGKVGVKYELRSTQIIKPVWYVPNDRDSDFQGQVEEDGFTGEDVGDF